MNVIRGPPRPPYQSPRPRDEIGASHCAHLTTRCLRSAQLDILSRFASGRHPWRPALVIRSPVRRFQRGLNTRATFKLLRRLRKRLIRLKIAEALTEGRGEAHGCAKRA
ncbi:hypothetical protein E7735_06795 [Enterobacter cloacae]|nr:hypothetical protein E7735_06795 [Enterobacter cloacae]QCC95676.1 hypothetical protein E7739_06490 [Enterobacter cloacae]QCD12375.1 hypothetical protein E7729_18060 [Enterobacter cloacae]